MPKYIYYLLPYIINSATWPIGDFSTEMNLSILLINDIYNPQQCSKIALRSSPAQAIALELRYQIRA
jgi:hypothetical protein